MSKPRVIHDKYTQESPIRVEVYGAVWHLTAKEGQDLYEQLGGVLMQIDPPDTVPPPADTEPGTLPETPVAIRRSSDRLAAVDLSETRWLAARVADELALGRQ